MELSRPDFLKVDEGHEVINESEKILVFATGDIAHVPHQIGIKRMPEVRYFWHFWIQIQGIQGSFFFQP